MNEQLIKNAKIFFQKKLKENEDPWGLDAHLVEAEKWARRAMNQYPQAREDVIMLTVWLHDIGYFPMPEEDHAVVSERVAREFLSKQTTDEKLIKEVLHCIRSHRNRDVKPESFEAKLFVMIDSISKFYMASLYCNGSGR